MSEISSNFGMESLNVAMLKRSSDPYFVDLVT